MNQFPRSLRFGAGQGDEEVMEFDQVFNLFEGIFWISISAIFFTRLRRAGQHRDLLMVGGGAFFLFGITDFIEIVTRAWYQPTWLLLMNGICVIALLTCLILYVRRARQGSRSPGSAGTEGRR